MKKIFAILVVIAGFSQLAKAQLTTTTPAAHQAILKISDAIDIAWVTTPADVSFTFANMSDFVNGVAGDIEPIMQVRSNKAYNLAVNAKTATFLNASGGSSGVTADKLKVQPVPVGSITPTYVSPFASGSFAALTFGSPMTMFQNLPPGWGMNQRFRMKFRAEPTEPIAAGNYTITIEYTATQP